MMTNTWLINFIIASAESGSRQRERERERDRDTNKKGEEKK